MTKTFHHDSHTIERCHSPEPCNLPVNLPGPLESSFASMESEDSITTSMASHGQAHLGLFQLTNDTRLSATRYSANSYKAKYLDGEQEELGMFVPYHCMNDERALPSTLAVRKERLKLRGNEADRRTFLTHVFNNSVPLSQELHNEALKYFRDTPGSTEDLPSCPNSTLRRIALGYAYDRMEQRSDSPEDKFWWKRGFMFKAARSDLGVISGRSDLKNPQIVSGEERSLIDAHVRANFGVVKLPDEQSHKEVDKQQGVLWLADDVLEKSEPSQIDRLWSLVYNDIFYLGAIHYQQAVYLASRRTHDNVHRPNSSIGQRVFGRELSELWGSEAYELHSSKDLGETFVYSGSANGAEYGVPQLPEVFQRYSEDPAHRASLTWLSDLSGLDAGDMVVQTMEKWVGDTWLSTRELNALGKGNA